jgi:two-component system phosphate regulon sensor histidine kinase PhoR
MFVSKGIDYSFESDTKEDIYIQSDAKLMKLALANLITNAYKYTEPGGKIEVDIHDTKDSVIISVADNGIGIPDKEKDKIFQDFYRTSISKQKGIEGSGLGMSVVLHYIKSMNGNITVESPSRLKDGDARPGTDFILTLNKKFNPYALDVQKFDMELSL